MKLPADNSPLPDHDAELENDPLWSLLDEGSKSAPSPAFVQDTLRRTRLEQEEQPWWKTFFASPVRSVSLACAGTAAAVAALVLAFPGEPAPEESHQATAVVQPATTDEWKDLEDAIAAGALTDAAEDPSLFSDQEIVALLY